MLRRLFLLLAGAGGVLSLGVMPAAHAGMSCSSTIHDTTINDSLIVPAGAVCELDSVTVRGNVLVQGAAQFYANDTGSSHARSVIAGSVSGSDAFLALGPADIGGSFSDLRPTAAGKGVVGVLCDGSTVGGSVTISYAPTDSKPFVLGQSPGCPSPAGVTIHGNATITGNNVPVWINGNTISGTLSCTSNNPAPTGSGNTAAAKNGQCATL